MNSRSFWLGVGLGLALTSVVLGVTSGAGKVEPMELELSETQLRDMAEARGLILIPSSEWEQLKEQGKKRQKEKSQIIREREVYIYVPKGFSWEQTARVLAKAGVVESPEAIMKEMRRSKSQKWLRPGLYTFEPGEQAKDVVAKLSKGKQ